ncbi:MAG: hypothetical protein PUF37_07830 [Prevotellaceae bacterium]|nr:hypothetical protein [Prevotellaceae bacterium]
MVTEREQREKEKTRREKVGGYFLNLSQLTFAASVLGGITPLFDTEGASAWIKITLGIISTIGLARIGNNILK